MWSECCATPCTALAGRSRKRLTPPCGPARSWLAQPVVQVIDPGPDHVGRVLKLLERLGTGANLVTDAQIAALAIEQGAILHTADADFQRFPGLRWLNPITAVSSVRLRKHE